MRQIISSVATQTLLYFSMLSHKGTICRRMLFNPKCVMTFSATLPETFLILRRIW